MAMFRNYILTMMLALLVACTHSGGRLQSPPSDTEPGGLIPGLQSPAEVAQRVSAELVSSRNGAAFDAQALQPNNVEEAGQSALYTPQWDVADSAEPGDLAYALYAFEFPDYLQGRFLSNGWLVAPAAADFWIGLGNQNKQTWDWFAATPGEQLVTPDLAPYLADSDMLLAIVALTGTGDFMLEWIGFEGYPPDVLSVTPTLGFSGKGHYFSATVHSIHPVSYAWDFGGGAIPNESDESTPLVVFGERGTYDAHVTALNMYGSDTWDFTLIVKEPPTASLNAEPTSGVAPQDVSFDASASFDVDGSITKFSWDWEGDGVYDLETGTDAQASHTYADVGEFEATVQVTDNDGAIGFDSTTLTIESGWLILDVPTSGAGAEFTSLAVIDGYPTVSCRTSSGLEYIRAEDANGSAWGTSSVLYGPTIAEQNISLAVVNSNPAIAFTDEEGSLNYIRASDSAGTSWQAVREVSSNGNCCSLAVVNGHPAIAYNDYTEYARLKYVRATDVNGTNWGTYSHLGGPTSSGCSLAVINGYPAVSYTLSHSNQTWTLYIARSSHIDGAYGWPSYPVNHDTNQRLHPSLALVDGHPAVCFLDWLSGDVTLQYVRATNADGTAWPLPMVLAHLGNTSTSDNSWSTSLAVVNGKPSVSSCHITSDELKYIGAIDAQGNDWGFTYTPYPYGGSWSSIAEVNGKPAISFSTLSGELKFATWEH